jgi:hypothetical protein
MEGNRKKMSRGPGKTQQRALEALKALEAIADNTAPPDAGAEGWYPFVQTWVLVLYMYGRPQGMPLAEYKQTQEYKSRYAAVSRALSGLLERGLVFHTKHRGETEAEPPLYEGHGGWFTRPELEEQWLRWSTMRRPSARGLPLVLGAPMRGSFVWEFPQRQDSV